MVFYLNFGKIKFLIFAFSTTNQASGLWPKIVIVPGISRLTGKKVKYKVEIPC